MSGDTGFSMKTIHVFFLVMGSIRCSTQYSKRIPERKQWNNFLLLLMTCNFPDKLTSHHDDKTAVGRSVLTVCRLIKYWLLGQSAVVTVTVTAKMKLRHFENTVVQLTNFVAQLVKSRWKNYTICRSAGQWPPCQSVEQTGHSSGWVM